MNNSVYRKYVLRALLVSAVAVLSACQDSPYCVLNGSVIDDGIIGTKRSDVLSKFGKPKWSDMGVKGFDEFATSKDGKDYALIIRYHPTNNTRYVSSQKCIAANPRLEIFGHILWH
ncbi:hypothetical protein [Psychrobacter aestuarii]|uniref:DUF3192 domain-containing protein n=1 Tax=Psychrobacter aestuarii TaxID=556327 RepID=A0ABN0VKU2_9GAMM|nr:hypothetical protein [Psychrobacter aestuarii]